MSAQLTITIDAESQALIGRMRTMPERLVPAIAEGLNEGGKLSLGEITAERFTGKGPFPEIEGKLGVETNRLRSSLRFTPAVISGTTITAAMGSNVIYFGVHEYGYNGQVHVGAFTRRQKSRDVREQRFTKTGKPSKAKGKIISQGTAQVSAHTRWLGMPARAPMGHGLADHAGEFTREISLALREAVGGEA